MKVKHRDLKPANILIMDGRVLITDFGISKDLIDQDTTASLNNSAGAIGTKMYCAPEVLLENGRRGRAADIYSMGCIFLEMSTVLLGPKGSLKKWSLHRELRRFTHLFKLQYSDLTVDLVPMGPFLCSC